MSYVTNKIQKENLTRAIKIFTVSMILTSIVTILTYIINPDITEIINNLSNNDLGSLSEIKGLEKVWEYIKNNGFKVPVQMLFLALIPIQYLYLVNLLVTVILSGILFGITLIIDPVFTLQLVLSSLPYLVVEIFGFCLFAALLFKLNQEIRQKIKHIFTKKNEDSSLKNIFMDTLKVYVYLVLPLIIIAAFTETYVADFLLSTLQRLS